MINAVLCRISSRSAATTAIRRLPGAVLATPSTRKQQVWLAPLQVHHLTTNTTTTTTANTNPTESTSVVIPFAVDAPDGTSEALRDAEWHQVEDMIDHSETGADALPQESLDATATSAQAFAVDGPDGESDDIHQKELHMVNEVIEYAADHEDKTQVEQMHQHEQAVRRATSERKGWPEYIQVP